mmetsp:Transcript_13202/g.29099  ORF Transcript_13202/g.29099 Transcript_13202/m.29099 type:complete len:83 (-) Transcript_13202:126-374(-)
MPLRWRTCADGKDLWEPGAVAEKTADDPGDTREPGDAAVAAPDVATGRVAGRVAAMPLAKLPCQLVPCKERVFAPPVALPFR